MKNKLRKITNQHGDLLFIEVSEIPKTAKKVKNLKPGYVLEHGEGIHTHIIEDIEGVEVFEEKGEIYVRVSNGVKINHEEHGVQILCPGIYKKRIEQVWDYETEESRRTLD